MSTDYDTMTKERRCSVKTIFNHLSHPLPPSPSPNHTTNLVVKVLEIKVPSIKLLLRERTGKVLMRIVTSNELELIVVVERALVDALDAADGAGDAVVCVLGLAHLVGVVHHGAQRGARRRLLVVVVLVVLLVADDLQAGLDRVGAARREGGREGGEEEGC